MQKEIENLIQKCKADYIKFACAGERGMPKEGSYFASEICSDSVILSCTLSQNFSSLSKM